MEDYKDGDLIDVENYRGEKEEEFSFSLLVMKIFKRILDIRSHELTEGRDILYTDEKGKQFVIYKEDQREAYFGALEIAMQLMRNKYDEEAKEKFKELNDKKEIIRKRNLLDQFVYWSKLSSPQKKEFLERYGAVSKYVFHDKLIYRENYFKEIIFLYDEIFGELNELIERAELFKGETLGFG